MTLPAAGPPTETQCGGYFRLRKPTSAAGGWLRRRKSVGQLNLAAEGTDPHQLSPTAADNRTMRVMVNEALRSAVKRALAAQGAAAVPVACISAESHQRGVPLTTLGLRLGEG